MAKTRVRAVLERVAVAAAFAVILSIALFAHGDRGAGDRGPASQPYVAAAPAR